jgi:uncharacterized radical SAM superfamily Fe-S cluster-containing enzyme
LFSGGEVKLNARAKGCRRENQAKEELEKAGWLVYRVPPSRQWQKQEDIFGLFDLLAVKKGKFKFVQVKSNRCAKFVHVGIKAFADEYFYDIRDVVSCEIWVFMDRGHTIKYLK